MAHIPIHVHKSTNPIIRPQKPASIEVQAKRWKWSNLLLAPHRLGFFFGVIGLIVASGWWALVLSSRVTPALQLTYAISPTLVHSSVMVFGFFPLFFAGFLFTAGPKWLHVPPLHSRFLIAPLALQLGGWMVWLVGAHIHQWLAQGGLAVAAVGLSWMTALFVKMLLRSKETDRVHAVFMALALAVGSLTLMGLLISVLVGADTVARSFVYTALWGCVCLVFVTAAHRMIPFFTSSAMPLVGRWGDFWVLWLMVAILGVEVATVWFAWAWHFPAFITLWSIFLGISELAVGAVLLWLAFAWGSIQSIKNRLLAMLYVGFMWLGLSFLLFGSARLLTLWQHAAVMPLGAIHATAMGCLASLTLAMVTRVSCAHSGRPQVADRWVWFLFWMLQVVAMMRVAASFQPQYAMWLLAASAVVWFLVMALWGGRLVSWFGRGRADSRPG